MGYLKSYFEEIPQLAAMVNRTTLTGFELSNRVDCNVVSADFRLTRGRSILTAILTETAFMRDEFSATPDTELFRALQPGLSTLRGRIFVISSPYRRAGLLFDAHQKYFGQNTDDAVFIKAATALMNPTIDKSIIDAAFVDDPESARAEWLAEFRSDISAFIDRDMIAHCIPDPSRHELPPMAGVQYRAFCDPSGGASDSMTLSVTHMEKSTDKLIVDCIRERKAPFSPDDVVAEFAGILKEYRIDTIRGDRYAGEWPRDRFAAYDITYLPAELPKSAIYLECLSMFTSGRVELLARRSRQHRPLSRRKG